MPLPNIDPANYPSQLAEKVSQFKLAFAPFAIPEPEVFPSAPEHYRLRAEFRSWHQDERLDYAMFDPENPKQPVMVEHFPMAAESICALMQRLLERLRVSQTLRGGLFQADSLATLSGGTDGHADLPPAARYRLGTGGARSGRRAEHPGDRPQSRSESHPRPRLAARRIRPERPASALQTE